MIRRAVVVLAVVVGAVCAGSGGRAAELRVASSGGFAAAYTVLVPEWERRTGHHLTTEWGGSTGGAPTAIPQRLARGEKFDVVIMAAEAVAQFVDQGKVGAEDDVKLARSGIGVVVKQGAPLPDVSTVGGFKQALLEAKSIAYSDGASGVYIEREMFKAMGIEDQVRPKSRMISSAPVGEMVAKGEAEIGFQQISELKPIVGITLVGPLPDALQRYTDFSAGVLVESEQKAAARDLVKFLASPEAATAIKNSGMEPAGMAR